MALSMRGQKGELRVSYQVAATLDAWTLDGPHVEATGTVDDFWVERGALSLWLFLGRKAWVWQRAELAGRDGRRLTIRVAGSPEVRPAA